MLKNPALRAQWYWFFLEFTVWMKAQLWLVKGFIYEMHFSELNIILQCAVFSAIQVQNKVFYRKISKGTRDNTSNLFWNTVAFQYFLTTEGKKKSKPKSRTRYLVCIFTVLRFGVMSPNITPTLKQWLKGQLKSHK